MPKKSVIKKVHISKPVAKQSKCRYSPSANF